jgi:3-isopropylmalate dehydratase small subunit
MRGRVWKFGDSIDTDVISPNQRAPTYEDLKKITMDAFRPEFAQEVKPGDILVGGKNFGCGSHRETANAVLRDGIFFRIGISFGMPTFVAPGIVGLVDDGEEIEINYSEGFIKNSRTGKQIPLEKYPPSIERIFMAGGIAPLIVERYEKEGG